MGFQSKHTWLVGLIFSLLLHFIVGGAAVFGLPDFDMDIPTPYWTQVDLVSAPAPKPLFEAPEEADAPAVSEKASTKTEEAPVVKNTKKENDLKKKKAQQKKKEADAKKKKEAEDAKKKQDELEEQKKEKNPKKATGKDAPMWASRNLTKHAPSGDLLAVLLRFDVMRGTEWAPRSAKVLTVSYTHLTLPTICSV